MCSVDSLSIVVALAVTFGLTFSLLDVVNTFQNIILHKEQIICIHLPPFYIEWFCSRYLSIMLLNNMKLVMQDVSAIQGAKTAQNIWNDCLTVALEAFNKMCI